MYIKLNMVKAVGQEKTLKTASAHFDPIQTSRFNPSFLSLDQLHLLYSHLCPPESTSDQLHLTVLEAKLHRL